MFPTTDYVLKLIKATFTTFNSVDEPIEKCNCPHWKGSSFYYGDTFICSDCGKEVTI